MMWWAIWCTVAVAGTAAAPASDALAPLALDLPQIESLTPEDESLGYAGPAGRYAAPAPLVYLLPDVSHDAQEWSGRSKRRAPTLSIDLPMAVLRHKLGLEQARKAQALRAAENRSFLNEIGKREVHRQWRAAFATETQDALAVHQQPHGGAAATAHAGGGPQADARGQPAAGRGQQTLLAERRQARILGELRSGYL